MTDLLIFVGMFLVWGLFLVWVTAPIFGGSYTAVIASVAPLAAGWLVGRRKVGT